MANEITYTGSLSVTKGNQQTVSMSNSATLATMTGTNVVRIVQNIATSAEALIVTDIGTAGFAYFNNMDGTNYVEIGTGTGGSFVPFLKLLAGEKAGPLRLGTSAPTAQANTTAVDLDYMIVET